MSNVKKNIYFETTYPKLVSGHTKLIHTFEYKVIQTRKK